MDGYVLKLFNASLAVFSISMSVAGLANGQQRTLTEPLYQVTTDVSVADDNETRDAAVPPAAAEKLASVDLAAMSRTLEPATVEPHPLDPALEYAEEKLMQLRENINDYQAVMIKQERIGDVLMPAEYMSIKVRNRRVVEGKSQPFSIYLKFLRPSSMKDREVIYVEGSNNGNLIAHEGGFANFITVNLPPTGMLAMRGNRYPITDAGIENLVEKLIERGRRDRAHGDCDVEFFENAKVLGRSCTMIQVKHDENKAPFDFHIGRIYIDDEHQVPIRYEAYTWPKEGETELPLLESYTYAKLKINVGLTDEDFNHKNEAYAYP